MAGTSRQLALRLLVVPLLRFFDLLRGRRFAVHGWIRRLLCRRHRVQSIRQSIRQFFRQLS